MIREPILADWLLSQLEKNLICFTGAQKCIRIYTPALVVRSPSHCQPVLCLNCPVLLPELPCSQPWYVTALETQPTFCLRPWLTPAPVTRPAFCPHLRVSSMGGIGRATAASIQQTWLPACNIGYMQVTTVTLIQNTADQPRWTHLYHSCIAHFNWVCRTAMGKSDQCIHRQLCHFWCVGRFKDKCYWFICTKLPSNKCTKCQMYAIC